MKSGFKMLSLAVAGVASLLASNAYAAPTVNLLGDTGTLRTETYAPPGTITSVTLTDPYGAPPVPTIVPVSGGFALTFTVTADFLARASNSTGGQTQTMDGKLDLLVTLSSAAHLTTNIYEDGIDSTIGGATVSVGGGVVVNEADTPASTETHGNVFSPTNSSIVFNPSGTWSLFDQVTGFAGSFTSYHVSIDNTLIAEALGTSGGQSMIAKKDFTVIFTTDGSNGGGPPSPEPASLGMLALGGVALLARRRK